MASYVQIKSGSGSGSSFNLTFDSPVTTGNAVVVCIASVGPSPTTISTLTDTQGNDYNEVEDHVDSGGRVAKQWAAFAAIGGSCTVTVTFGTPETIAWAILELVATEVSTNVGAQSGNTTTHQASNLANTNDDAVFVLCGSANVGLGAVTVTAGDGYTARAQLEGLYVQTKDVVATETNDASFTTSDFRRFAHAFAVYEAGLIVNAGPDQTKVLPPGTGTLAGFASGGSGVYTYEWTVQSAPPAGIVTFDDDTDNASDYSVSHHGTYVLRLTADDGSASGFDDMTITVSPPSTGATYAVDDVPLTRVIEKIERRGVRISLALGSNWTCDLATYDNDSTAGAYRPNLRDNLSVDYEGQRLFKGPVTTRRDTPRARTNKGNICHITAKANVLVSEQLQVDDFEAAAGQTLEQIVTALHTHGSPSLADHGIALDPSMPTGPTLAEVTSFDGVTFQQAFNRLMERTGSIIRITPDDVLQAFAPGDEVCAYALTATNGLARGAVTWEESSSKFVNRVTVEFGSGTFAVTETLAADGIDYSFPLAYTYVADFETVNNDGTQEIATRQGIGFDLAVQWLFYPPAVVGDPWTLRRETTGVPDPPAAGTITVTYLAQFPMRVTVEDAGSIATDGLWHRKYQRPDIFDIAEATEEADGLLRVNGATPKTITVRTREYPMPLPGDVINLNFPDRLIPDDDYLITRVAAEDYVDQKFEFVLTCVEGTEPQQSWTDTLKSLIGAG
jgi:hypothetical protein